MRIVAGIALIVQALAELRIGVPTRVVVPDVFAIAAGLLLLVGLWTPIAGVLAAVLSFWNAFSQPGDPWAGILLGTLGAALALVGPGAWSIDARLFGWKRIDVRDRGDRPTPR